LLDGIAYVRLNLQRDAALTICRMQGKSRNHPKLEPVARTTLRSKKLRVNGSMDDIRKIKDRLLMINAQSSY
jgi:hypothetical protein